MDRIGLDLRVRNDAHLLRVGATNLAACGAITAATEALLPVASTTTMSLRPRSTPLDSFDPSGSRQGTMLFFRRRRRVGRPTRSGRAMPCPLSGGTAGFQFNAGNAIKIFISPVSLDAGAGGLKE